MFPLTWYHSVCKQQQKYGDANVVGIFISKVGHQGSTAHQLYLCVSTKHRWYKQSPPLLVQLYSQALHWDGDRCLWASVSDFCCCLASQSPILSISFSCRQTLARSSLKPSWISMAPALLLPGALQTVRSDGRKMPQAMMVSKSTALNPKHRLSSPMMMTVFQP